MVHEIQGFFGVYILYCTNPSYKGRTYIGFTVDPNRRIKQHNTGRQAGGAWRTHGRGPWEMVLITHGFPNMISALRFEWAWQNPEKSRRLKMLPKKKRGETVFQHKIAILNQMLQTGPWNRLPLTIRWLQQSYFVEFDVKQPPPAHMSIVFGPVKSQKTASVTNDESDEEDDGIPLLKAPSCIICHREFTDKMDVLKCLIPTCKQQSHVRCLANHFLSGEEDQLVPVEGKCPCCNNIMLWGDLIRNKMGCLNMDAVASTSMDLDT